VDVLDNKYQIEQLLGQGGMGAVYRATHLGTKRTVALKVIHPQLTPKKKRRFPEETATPNPLKQRGLPIRVRGENFPTTADYSLSAP
jgi:eukaryotic-like serine/threonine-protein kinase